MSVSVKNLKINNVLASQGVVRIVTPLPTISWEFDADDVVITTTPPGGIASIELQNQDAYEVRLGTLATNLGTNSFSGNIAATGIIAGDACSWRYGRFSLLRGSTYYGQVRVRDGYNNTSEWATFSFRYNALPVITGLEISPENPVGGQSISASYLFGDTDGDVENGSSIKWFRNGVRERQLDGALTVSGNRVIAGDEWAVEVLPHDGYEFGRSYAAASVSIGGSFNDEAGVLTNAAVRPLSPTPADPFFAYFDRIGNEPVSIRWYVNDVNVAAANDRRFYRFDVVKGDVIRFEAWVVAAGENTKVYSAAEVVVATRHIVQNLRVNGLRDAVAAPSDRPEFTWDVISHDGTVPEFVSVKIGRTRGADDVFSETVIRPDSRFVMPGGLLDVGCDYWVTVSVGVDEAEMGASDSAHFRLAGSLWDATVNNETGWTVEGSVSVQSAYHGFRIADGVKFAEVRLLPDAVVLVSKTSASAPYDFSKQTCVTVTGRDGTISVFCDGKLAVSASLQQGTSERYLEFGRLTDEGVALWQGVRYTTEGSLSPDDDAYQSFLFESAIELPDREVTALCADDGDLYVATVATDEAADIFRFSPRTAETTHAAISRTYSAISGISSSPTGRHVYFSHADGATYFRSHPVVAYDHATDLTAAIPEADGWHANITIDRESAPTADGLMIDTRKGGQWFYSQDRHGTAWFDLANHSTGWVADFTLAVVDVLDDNLVGDTTSPSAIGVYVNDGEKCESIHFFPEQIIFESTGVSASIDTTHKNDYRLACRDGSLELWSRADGDESFSLIARSRMVRDASPEGNAGRPVACEDANGNTHVVWHDDGNPSGRQIMYSRLLNGGWTIPRVIVPSSWNASNPRIAAKGDSVYVVFEQRNGEYSNVGMVVRDGGEWSYPLPTIDAGVEARRPQIAIDGLGGINIVWMDRRHGVSAPFYMRRHHLTGSWSQPRPLATGPAECDNPSIDASGSTVAIAWATHEVSGRHAIRLSSTDVSSGIWATTVEVTGADSKEADFCDVCVQASTVHIAWHDNKDGEFEIYARRYDLSLTSLSSVIRLTNSAASLTYAGMGSRFPRIAHAPAQSKVIAIFQKSNDVDADASATPNAVVSGLCAAIFNTSTNSWHSSGVSGADVELETDARYSRRPTLAKHLSGMANVVYETEIVVSSESQRSADSFTSVRHAIYDYSQSGSYAVSNSAAGNLDLPVSGQLPRKEIRFGDFSGAYKGRSKWYSFSVYMREGFEPFTAGVVSARTSAVTDGRTYRAAVSASGNAWLGTNDGLWFHFADSNRVARVSGTPLSSGPVVAIAVSEGNAIVASNGSTCHYSLNHVDFGTLTITTPAGGSIGSVRDMVFDDEGRLWVATSTGVLGVDLPAAIASTTPAQQDAPATLIVAGFVWLDSTRLPSGSVNVVTVDSDGIVWAGTDDGLASYDGNRVQTWTKANSPLPSRRVVDIAIRGPASRFVATPAGVVEMSGGRMARLLADDVRWNNNVRSVEFVSPNTLWVATVGGIAQVQLGDRDGRNRALAYDISNYAIDGAAYDDLRTFYVQDITDESPDASRNAIIEVLVNGRRVDYGYVASDDRRIIQFETPLRAADLVQVRFLNSLSENATLRQNPVEVEVSGRGTSRVDKMRLVSKVVGTTTTREMYCLAEIDGKRKLCKYAVDGYSLPYDEIVLDTTPPEGELQITKIIDRHRLLVHVAHAEDNISGISKMVISNWPNFTTDGSTPQTPVDFSEDYVHTLDSGTGGVALVHTFANGQGSGNRAVRFKIAADDDTWYVGTSSPAKILRWDKDASKMVEVATLDPNISASVDRFAIYKNVLYATVGHEAGTSQIYYTRDGLSWNSLGVTVAAPHVYASCEFFGMLYFGDSRGKVYRYNGGNPQVDAASFKMMWDTGQPTIHAMSAADRWLYCATGDRGNLVTIDVISDSQAVAYTDPDSAITSVDVLKVGSKFTVYLGTGTTARVLSRPVSGGVFEESYRTLSGTVKTIKIDDLAMRMSIGKSVYAAFATPSFTGWTPVGVFEENVVDFEPSATSGSYGTTELLVVTASKVYLRSPKSAIKTIYLRLIDNAGNASANGGIFETINAADIDGFNNTNRILTLTPQGTQLDYIDGTKPYRSVQKIEYETGEYLSEVFFGTNNLISWDFLQWEATTPAGTEATIYLRAADSRAAVQVSEWQASYTSAYKSGVNISFLRGRYIQFKVVLSTTAAGVTPTISNVVIRSKASESTHFFTTNFILGKKLKRGILTARTFQPLSSQIIFGINTSNSTEFADYQIVEPNRIFTADSSQTGTGLRVGVKFITPTPATYATDDYGDTGPGGVPLMANTIVSGLSEIGQFHFRASFYSDAARSNLVAIAYSGDDQSGWSVDGTLVSEDGVSLVGDEVKVRYVPTGDTGLQCNTYYYPVVEAVNLVTEDSLTIEDEHAFISACNTTFVDTATFSYKAQATATHQFRLRMYSNPERTKLVKAYLTSTAASLWTIDDNDFSAGGVAMTNNATYALTVTPPKADMVANKIYYLSIDAFDGTSFGDSLDSYTIRVSDPEADVACGDSVGVPILKNFAMVFELEDRSLVTLNLQVPT